MCYLCRRVLGNIAKDIYDIMCSVHLHTGITAGQKRANFSASFNAHCLVVSQEFATLHTHTHTHTHNVRTYCSVTLFSFLLRAREVSATLISKGLFGVPFASLFVPVVSGAERQNHTLVRTRKQPLLQVPYSIMRSIRLSARDKKQPCRGWSVGRAGLASVASLPCLQHTERKQGRRSWSVSSLPHNDCWSPESIPSPSYTGIIDRIFPHMFYL